MPAMKPENSDGINRTRRTNRTASQQEPPRKSRRLRKKSDEDAVAPPAEVELMPELIEDSGEEGFSRDGDEAEVEDVQKVAAVSEKTTAQKRAGLGGKSSEESQDACFIGDFVPDSEAKRRWPDRYQKKHGLAVTNITSGDEQEVLDVKHHYLNAKVDGVIYNLYDDAYVKADDGVPDYICRIVELFETKDRKLYFTARWFYRAEDTVIKEHASCHGAKAFHDPKRVFLSEVKNDNLLDSLVNKITIVRVEPNPDLEVKRAQLSSCDFYYDMSYSPACSTFANLPPEISRSCSEASSSISSEDDPAAMKDKSPSDSESSSDQHRRLSLLDLYSGCGAMSTGLCLGVNMTTVQIDTRWAVDLNEHACQSLKLNHPHTEVRNENAENFLALLKEWEILCKKFNLVRDKDFSREKTEADSQDDDDDDNVDCSNVPKGEFEVGKLVGICYGDPCVIGTIGLKFKVRWKGYGPSDDTWEPIDGLSKCNERIERFVRDGFRKSILPLPSGVDVICGGPPCQGISGFNRFRNRNAPLQDVKNKQMVVFMDIVEFLKPKYVLMENVVDILKFANGFLGRYALSRLVAMNYQARLGMMVAGCYGLPQFRMRAFLWGASTSEVLPQFPLPTHNVVVRGGGPNEFEQNMVAYNEYQRPVLCKALLLEDAISDLPPVSNHTTEDEMPYSVSPKTEFQRFIRLPREEVMHSIGTKESSSEAHKLYDHRPLQLNEDDYQRVCQIPKRKGANFRDLPGVKIGPENVVEWDLDVERVYLPSGKPLVPDYAMSFCKGKSTKPFGRMWWDETVPTVVTRAEPHNQSIIHPEQDRVLSIRENARLQGFPDYYKLKGPVKERYIQVGNAVAVPVARALGYALGLAIQGRTINDQPVFTLPSKFFDRRMITGSVEPAESIE